ncbi:uncharacterized protein SCHCODRAFT_02745584 [Schizophyllum commune H4-8]|uniref:uncharacterized protein n=1 Tax=Schizophyllum commune (strain H4-8 / FGSC 9210) TaxID=578458 RepID=UPI00215F9F0F|nr:uncharacterized protein SCHCODRAFT_02745584 [Schizophyllum commune H4-8]KAI5896648.1 hypothetical protein SCHCODRAFT_02745584 [Schizophyllum commune H4-8]
MSTTSLQTSMGQQQVEQPLHNRGYRSYLPNPLVDTNGAAAADPHSSPRSADLSGPPRWETFPQSGNNPNGPGAPNGGSRGYFDSGHGPVQLPSPTERLAPSQDAQREPSSGPDRRRHRSSPVAYANAASPSTYHARHGSEGADSSATFSSNSSGSHPRHHSDGANAPHRCMSPRLAPILGEPAASASSLRLPPIVDHPSDKGAMDWTGHMAWRMTPQGPVASLQESPPIMSHPPSSDGPPVNDPAHPRHARVQSDVTDAHSRVHHPVPRLKTKTKLTTERRKEICRFAMANPSARQEDIATAFSIERSTVSKILKHRKEWLARPDDEAERAKNRPIKYPIIEQHLEEDLERWRRERKPITDIAIKRRALEIAQDASIYSPEHREFKASQGWVEAFKQRYGIKNQSFPGQAALEEYRRLAPPPPPNTTGQGFVYWNERAPRSPSPNRQGHDQHGQYRGDPAAAGASHHPHHQPSSHDAYRPPWGRVDEGDNERGLASSSGRDGYRSERSPYDRQGSGSGQGHQAPSNEDIIPAVRSLDDPLIEFAAEFKSRAARGDLVDANQAEGRVCFFDAFDLY